MSGHSTSRRERNAHPIPNALASNRHQNPDTQPPDIHLIPDTQAPDWHGRPYYSLDAWCKNTLHRKCYKIALNAHMTCPNRDGSKGTRGCIFCSAGGSGEFAVSTTGKSVPEQLAEGEALLSRKTALPRDIPCIIAYFQAYTNTYAPVEYLEQVFSRALSSPRVCGISIATRPDCLPEDVLVLLSSLKDRFPEKFLWVELGLQTIHESTARFIRRGYDLHCFEDAYGRLQALGIPVILHVILGLPGNPARKCWRPWLMWTGCAPLA